MMEAITITEQAADFPDPRFEAARIQGDLSVHDLWARYLRIGGHGDIFDIDAHLKGLLTLDPTERDTLAWALNERLDELAAAAQLPYHTTSQPTTESLREAISDLLDGGWDPAPDTAREAQ